MFSSIRATTSNYLSKGSSLSVEHASSKYLISLDKTFTCGFYTFNATTNAYYFSIWYTNSKERTLVWVANPGKPVNGRGSRLSLWKDGGLVLTDFDDSNVWETNTFSTTVDRVVLHDSGNLVLMDFSGKTLWQSFDYPTDTLLPNQNFTKNQKLISRISPQLLTPGYFSFFFDSDNVLKMVYDGSEFSSLYWPNPNNDVFANGRTSYNSRRVAVLDDKGVFVSSDYLHINTSDMGDLGVKRRLTMDYDGNLRIYSLNNLSGLWTITWLAMSQQCGVHGLCGRNGICTYTPTPKCACPPYYEPFDSTDWSKGCKPKFKMTCSNSRFVEMPKVDYYGFDLNYTTNITFEHCRNLCSGDCRCQAFKHALRSAIWSCYLKGDLYNGYMSNENLFLKIPTSAHTSDSKIILNVSRLGCGIGDSEIVPLPRTYNDAFSRRFKWVYVYSFGGAIGAIEAIIFVASWFFVFKKNRISASLAEGYRTICSQFRSFSYSELKRATGNFKQVLGEGGSGTVYKGTLADEREVAVKKLENIGQGEEEFWAEVSTFGRINHMNLARIWGFCSEGKHRLLVYEYVENGSLDNHLFLSANKTAVLKWETRFKIALGTAKGLAYLHHECLEWVIHCDVKPENILLDSDFEPKISDFGLSKLCQQDDSLGEEEIKEFTSYVRLAKAKMQDEDDSWMTDFVDPRLDGDFKQNQAAIMIEIGILCMEDDRNKRPTMEAVVLVLSNCEADVSFMHSPSNDS
ncbi:hypothetical protein BVRB_8g201460 [Beta vulgaris subsp. vulgaris]|uniref:Receptor-like serine/threonine-protein kinase n=1 Tax=Beta vulgaris subsp. vulgaris TaxID=3555 RepID=A0A0J8B6J9_BETVV|nr:hypothetical protein BVRB_8g201460 [Beta vulgaris subsp. vulgaris]